MATYKRLEAEDAYYLHAESPTMHNHVGILSIFEDPGLSFQDIRDHVESRLHLVHCFRKKLMFVPFSQGRPVWVDDDRFDIGYHVRHSAIPAPGGARELTAMMARIMSIPLDRTRPLWELWVVDMPDGRKAIMKKHHHSLADGLSEVDMATLLWDNSPECCNSPPTPWVPEPAPSRTGLLLGSWWERLAEPKQTLNWAQAAVRAPGEATTYLGDVTEGMVHVATDTMKLAPATSLTRPIGAHRRFEIVEVPLDEIKEIKNSAGCTVNDVVLAAVAGGLRHLLLQRGDDVADLDMRALIPVSFRASHERMTFGNKVAALVASLPVGLADARERLAAVHANMAHLKETHEALGAEAIMRLATFAPPTLLALAGRLSADYIPANLLITNVPGPQYPLFLHGARMLKSVLFAPVSGTATLNVAVLSYNGQVTFGIVGDWDAVPDLAVLREGIEMSIAELAPRPAVTAP